MTTNSTDTLDNASLTAGATPTADRAEWQRAKQAYEDAKAASDAFTAGADRTFAAWKEGQPKLDMAKIKACDGMFFGMHPDHIEHGVNIAEAREHFIAGKGKFWWTPDPEAKIAEVNAALDYIKAHRAQCEAFYRDSGMEAANEKSEALTDALTDAHEALMNMPAPDLAALRWKLETFREDDGDLVAWTAKYVGQTFADLARLIPEAK